MGDKKMYIDNGIRGLAETKGCRIEAVSYTHLDVYKRQIIN